MKEKVSVIFEDDDLLIIDKPSGLVVHSDGRTKEATLADWVLLNYPDMRDVGEPWEDSSGKSIPRPGIVHRLDRETSGIMVLAKNQECFESLKEAFKNREVKKTYRVFVYGVLREKEGVIEKPIGKSRRDFRKWSAEYGARGKLRDAVTEYRVISEVDAEGLGISRESGMNGVSYLEVRPKTGRTHQIRVHLKSMGNGVVCDQLYAPKQPKILGFKRLALHAHSLQFATRGGGFLKFEAPMPADFETAERVLARHEPTE